MSTHYNQEAVTVVNVASCPQHGLHGDRTRCFVCNEAVEQVSMVEAKALQEAIASHIEDTATTAGMLNSIAAAIPQSVYQTQGMTAGVELVGIIEGGVPDVIELLERQLREIGGDPEKDVSYWRYFCRGYQTMDLLRERAPASDPRWKQDPEEWMKARTAEATNG